MPASTSQTTNQITPTPTPAVSEPEPARYQYAIAADLDRQDQIPVYDRVDGHRRTLLDINTIDGIELPYPLFARTAFGGALVLRVIDASEDDEWLKVQVPVRPNMSTVWVRAADFELRSTTVWIEASTSPLSNVPGGQLRVWDGTQLLLDTVVASGRDSRPTPNMTGWIGELIPGPSLGPAYGPWVIDLGGHSEALATFGGGGQPRMVFHGTNQPSTIGQRVSSGALRLFNETLDELAAIDGLVGAPVVIRDTPLGHQAPSFHASFPATTIVFQPNAPQVIPVAL